jgi:hypothetical protein
MVVVPSADKDARISVAIVVGLDGKRAEDCDRAGWDDKRCIIQRRQVRFLPHEELILRVDMPAACAGMRCDVTTTCVPPVCVPDAIVDPGSCHGAGCDPRFSGGWEEMVSRNGRISNDHPQAEREEAAEAVGARAAEAVGRAGRAAPVGARAEAYRCGAPCRIVFNAHAYAFCDAPLGSRGPF